MPLAIIGYFLREDGTGNNSYVVFGLRGKRAWYPQSMPFGILLVLGWLFFRKERLRGENH